VKLALWLWVAAGGACTRVVTGAIVSGGPIVHCQVAGVGSGVPCSSVATTSKLWTPSARPVYCAGEVQASGVPPSSEHRKVEFSSVEKKPKLALVSVVGSSGPLVISVCGAVPSITVHVQLAGVRSTLPSMSSAATSNVCVPREIDGKPSSVSGNIAGDRHSPSSTPSR
jgi:hypothetical protein